MRNGSPHLLNNLYDYYSQKNTDPLDVGIEALMAVADGDLAEAGAADGGGHGRVAEDSDHRDHGPHDEGGLGLRQQHFRHDLEIVGAHGLGCLNDPGVDLLEGGFHHTRNVRGGRNHQHHDHSLVAKRRAHNEVCHRQHRHHQDDKGDGAEKVDDDAEHPVEPADGVNPFPVRDVEHHAQRQADHIGDGGGKNGHVDRFPDAALEDAGVPELVKGFGQHQTSSFHLTGLFLSQVIILAA